MGRPKAETAKVHIGFRLAPDVVASVKASGPGNNTRVEEALRKAGFGAAKTKPARKKADRGRHRPLPRVGASRYGEPSRPADDPRQHERSARSRARPRSPVVVRNIVSFHKRFLIVTGPMLVSRHWSIRSMHAWIERHSYGRLFLGNVEIVLAS